MSDNTNPVPTDDKEVVVQISGKYVTVTATVDKGLLDADDAEQSTRWHVLNELYNLLSREAFELFYGSLEDETEDEE